MSVTGYYSRQPKGKQLEMTSERLRDLKLKKDKACKTTLVWLCSNYKPVNITWLVAVAPEPMEQWATASFKLDTGASVTVVGESMVKSKKLRPAKNSLWGPGNTPLNVLGVFTATLSHYGTAVEETVFVLVHQHSGLLSHSVCARLGLIQW